MLAVIKAKDFDEALAIANNTEYGLTGAIYSSSREKLDRARAGVPRRQSLPQPQVHRSHGRRASLRRLQHERHRLQGRRPRLSLLFTQAKSDRREESRPRQHRQEQEQRMGM